MINLALRTEYSFKKTLGKISDLHRFSNGENAIGIADFNNTYGHYKLEKLCAKYKLKPIFGVRLQVVRDSQLRVRRASGPWYIFIAKNNSGLQELYRLVKSAWDNFYYKPMLPVSEMKNASRDIFVISNNPCETNRLDFLAITHSTLPCLIGAAPPVLINDNTYSTTLDKETYELFAGARKHKDSFRYLFEDQTYPMHILSKEEIECATGFSRTLIEEAAESTKLISESCDAKIQHAPMVKAANKFDIKERCLKRMASLKLYGNEEYSQRLNMELEIIREKDFEDYFMIVSDMVNDAKKTMLVGPARGSSAGSLVCYLLGITEVDPLQHGLVFERFIDINRPDLPDIDVDFPDHTRDKVIKKLFRKYGDDNVYHISNINSLGPKSALDEFGMSLNVPKFKIEQTKESIVDRSGGDARSAMALEDTINTTEVGKMLLEEYPKMRLVEGVQGHATHASKHAAGVIVCNHKLTDYCGVNTREKSIMMDKKEAESINLLKIDCLGLRTLSILEDAAKLAGLDFDFFYSLGVEDEETYKIFQELRLSGIFQFEGNAMKVLCKEMNVDCFNDIVAITALARPGPLHSGAAMTYIKRRNGEKPTEYSCNHEEFVKVTKDTYGIIAYQEQLMYICKNVGNLPWEDVNGIRRAISKTLGKHTFDAYKEKFINGALENGLTETESVDIWEAMISFGAWAMNKSHSVSYAYISYWCAFMKRYYPVEFTAANLNHSRNKSSSLKILRDAVKFDNIEYIPVDPDESKVKWTISDSGILLGGLTNITGIADKKAEEIIYKRENKLRMTPGIVRKLLDPKTDYDILYPTQHYWGDLYKNPQKYGLATSPIEIATVEADPDLDKTVTIIGKVIIKDLRDLNEYNEVVKRGGKTLSNNHLFLRLVIEDDTDQVMCKINRFDYDRLEGQKYYETLSVDKSWVIIKGTMKPGWRIINIKAIFDLSNLDMGDNND